MPRIITCLMCGGKGYTTQFNMEGTPHPVTCKACGGSGKQEVHDR